MRTARRMSPPSGPSRRPPQFLAWLLFVSAALAGGASAGPAAALAPSSTDRPVYGRFEVRAWLTLVKRRALETDLERMMEGAGLGDDLDRRPFTFQRYPTSATGDAGSVGIGLSCRVAPLLGVSVAWDHALLVRTLGRRSIPSPVYLDTSRDLFLEVTERVTTVSTRVVWRGPLLRAEAGPALLFIDRRSRPSGGAEEHERRRRFGVVLGVGASVPPDSRVFLDLAAQYRVVGAVRHGPILVTSSSDSSFTTTSSIVPGRRLLLNHGAITMGLGVRW